MKMITHLHRVICFVIFMCACSSIFSQRFINDYDSTLFIRDTVLQVIKRFENLHISGYMQPQFQVAEKKGVSSFNGGNFAENTNSRFMLRRARIKLDYILPSKENFFPKALFSFQFEATERDLNIRDMYVRVYEPKKQNFSFTMGLFGRPFGYEVNLSSSYRETPERGRASQILMPSERDLGAMITYESQSLTRKNPLFKFDAGIFNGQGKSGPVEFDSYKDVIARLALKPLPIAKSAEVSAGLSLLNGGWVQTTRYKYEMVETNNSKFFQVDSSLTNMGRKAPRHYYGADVQLIFKHKWGKTEWRAEYWRGKQSGTANTTLNPGALPTAPTYIRNFDAAFFYFLQNIINSKYELMIKYDWYDANTKIKSKEIGKPGTNMTEADVRFTTLGIGFTRYLGNNLKIIVYQDFVQNEKTLLSEFLNDIPDNVFTLRIQLRF